MIRNSNSGARNLQTEAQYEDGLGYDGLVGIVGGTSAPVIAAPGPTAQDIFQQFTQAPPAPASAIAPAPAPAPAPASALTSATTNTPPGLSPEAAAWWASQTARQNETLQNAIASGAVPADFDLSTIYSNLGISEPEPWQLQEAYDLNQKQEAINNLTSQITAQWQGYGLSPDIKGINRANELAQILSHYGITDLSKLGLKQTPYEEIRGGWQGGDSGEYTESLYKGNRGQLTYDDKTYGHLIGFGSKGEKGYLTRDPFEYLQEYNDQGYKLTGSSAGKGAVDYILLKDAQGNIRKDAQGFPVLVPQWRSTSDITPELIQFLALAAMPFTGGLSASLGTALGSQVAGQIASQALIQGGLGGLGSAAQGGDFLSGFGKGALTGGLTAGIGSLAAPFAQGIGADVLSSTGSQTLSDAVTGAIKGGAGALPAGLISGDFSNVLTGALSGGVGGATSSLLSDLPSEIRAPVSAAVSAGVLGKDPTQAAIMAYAGDLMKSFGPAMPGTGGEENIQEGFFEPGGEGFMPTEELSQEEVDRELRGLMNRYPAPPAPSDWFLGENVPSGIPEWDYAAASAGLPIGNLEQDFSVAQTKTGPVVTDSAGNVGTFVNGEFVPDTGLTPSGAPSAAPAPGKAPTPGKAPAPGKPAVPAAPSGPAFDPSLLFALGAMMTPQQQKQQEQYQTARTVASPFGMDLIL